MPALPGGGAEKVLIDILANFDKQRYKCTLLLEYRDDVYTSSIPEGVEVKYLYKRCNIWIERFHRALNIVGCYHLFHTLVYRLLFLWLLRKRKFDTIVSFMEGEAVRIHSYLFRKAKRHISWIHIDFSKKHWSLAFFKNRTHERECYARMDKLIFVSVGAKRGFLQMYSQIQEENCRVIYNLIDRAEILKLSESKQLPKARFVICMAGRLNAQKRYDRAIDALKMLKEAGYDVEMWILGTGELEESLKSRCCDNGVEHMCRFWGFVRPPYAYMKYADIYLNTSESEGYPLVLCEALCLGLPVVATNITGAQEILADSEYGLLVEERVLDIYNGLKTLISDEALRGKYKDQAKLRAEQFSIRQIMNDIYEVL